ncbi:MAG: hypothetical protein U0992_10570 [Planctomycetaceae bacterium]
MHAALLVTTEGLYLRDLSGRCSVRVDGRDWWEDGCITAREVSLGDVQFRVLKTDPVSTADRPMQRPTTSRRKRDDGISGRDQDSGDDRFRPEKVAKSITGMLLHHRYRIVKRLARGGMGIVYLGHDVRLHRWWRSRSC